MKNYFKNETIIITILLCGPMLIALLLSYVINRAATYERIMTVLLATVLLISILSFYVIFIPLRNSLRNLKKSAGKSSGKALKPPSSPNSESQEISEAPKEQ